MIRYVLTLLVCCVSVVGEAQMRSLRLNYKPLMDTIVMDKEDTLIYEVKGLKQPTFADTVPNYCKPYIYTLIFRGMYDKLVYTPTMTFRQSEMTKLDSLREMVRRPLDTDIALGYAPFDVLCYRYMIDNPSDVKYTWQAIPDVEDRIKNRRKRNHEQEDYNELLKMFDIQETNVSMRKRPEPEKSPWVVSGEENVQFSQLHVNEHWAKGGESSVTLISDLRIKAKYEKGKHMWENNITHKLGVTYLSAVSRARVSDDVVDMSSKYGYKAISKWYYSFLNTFKTQLFTSYNKNDEKRENPLSSILSPAYIQFTFGMDYREKNISILLSPYTAVVTLVADTSKIDQTRYSIDEDKHSKTINGLSITVNWKKAFTPDIRYETKMEMFYEYFVKEGSKRFHWENVFDVQLNRFLSTRLLCEIRYYDNEVKKFQFKENFSIALKFSF